MKTPEAGKVYYYHRANGNEYFVYINEFNDENYNLYVICTSNKSIKKIDNRANGIDSHGMQLGLDNYVVLQGPESEDEYKRAFIQIIFLHL